MKLFVIVLCLLSERFLVHVSSHHRFSWFQAYSIAMEQRLSRLSKLSSPWVMLVLVLAPLMTIACFIFYGFASALFGLVGLLFNIVIFYYCLGPSNPFYPIRSDATAHLTFTEIETYLTNANGQLFAVLFWYIFLGPISLLTYRLISLSQNQPAVAKQAKQLTNILDWIPTRMTALLYLLVGNFQAGLRHFAEFILESPQQNQVLLGTCGMQALRCEEGKPLSMLPAENLVGRAVIVLLVLLACYTLIR